jgi:hypothetical protein
LTAGAAATATDAKADIAMAMMVEVAIFFMM